MVSQSQDGEWDRSGSMLSLDGRQRPPVARTPPSYYDAVRSRHSLSQPVSRQTDPNKQDRLYLPQQEKYNSLPRPLPQRCAAPMTNGHDKGPSVRGGPWTGSPPHPPSPNSCVTAWKAGADRSCPPRQEYHEFSSPPGPANAVPQVHQFPPRPREAIPGHHLQQVGTYPGRQQQTPELLQQYISQPHFREQQLTRAAEDGFQVAYGAPQYGDPPNFPAQYIQKSSQQRLSPPGGPRLHPPPPPPVTSVSPPHLPLPANVHYPMGTIPNGVELRRSRKSNGRDPEGSPNNNSSGRFVRRSYPTTSEDYAVYGTKYFRSQSQDQIQCQSTPAMSYDPRYSRGGTLPLRQSNRGSDPVVPAPAVAVRTGPLGTYPESRPVHSDQLPPPSSMDLTSGGPIPGDRRGSKSARNSGSEDVCGRIKEAVKPRPLSSTRSLDVLSNGPSLRKTSMTSSNASLCSEASSASSRLRRPQPHYISNEEVVERKLPASPKNKMSASDPSSPRKQEKNAVFSPSPWAREEKEQLQRQQVQGARRARDEEIAHLENLPNRTKKQEELLRILRLEREFQRRAEEMGDRDDDEDEDEELLDRAEHMEKMLMMQEEISRSRAQRLQRTTDKNQQPNGHPNDDWITARKIPHLSRIAEENGETGKDSSHQNGVDLEQLSDLLDSLSLPELRIGDFAGKEDHGSDEMKINKKHTQLQNYSNGTNVVNHESRRQTTFPIPAPRRSKTTVPPPVPPKSKPTPSFNGCGTSGCDDHGLTDEIVHQTMALGSSTVAENPSSNISKGESCWPRNCDFKVVQLTPPCENGATTNGFAKMATAVNEVDVANLYASSKMRNGYVDSRKELDNSPELKKLWNSRPEKLTFMDKIRKFSLQAGEGEVPRDKVKNSRAQREIESKFSESQTKCATAET